ncbi:hypothetical protein V8E55_003951 [Tylopilus felleus]
MKFGICRLHHILLPVNLQRIAQMDKQPPVTALRTTDYENVELSSWLEPFEELLLLVKIIDRRGDDTRYQEFRFRHTHDLFKISDVFLYLDVDEGIRYSIDLHTFCFPPEHQGRTWVVQLEQYANGVLSRFRDYRNRLIEGNIILPSDTSSFGEVNLSTCPLCRSSLTTREACNTIVACSDQDCEGSQDIEQCSNHDYSICYKCLNSAKSPDEFHFVQCPSCHSWSCDDAVLWCGGCIIHPELSTEELVKQSRNRQLGKEVVRSHPRTPGPCRSCIDSGHANAWQTCSAKLCSGICPSRIDDACCPECIPETKGRRCVCGAVWTCDACLVDYSIDPGPSYPKLISCPRCGTDYCMEGCRYCHFCCICRCTSICVVCQTPEGDFGEEDMSGNILQPSSTVEKCLQCPVYMCNECCSAGKDGVKQCSGCQGRLCQRCAGDMRRDRCIPCSQNA